MTYSPDGTSALDKRSLGEIPATTGVYIYRHGSEITYVGKAVSLRARLLSHLQNASTDKKEAAIQQESTNIDYIITDSEFKALVLEAHLISTIKPKYNVRWRDDKSYLYIKITMGEDYPKVSLARAQDIATTNRFNTQSSVQSIGESDDAFHTVDCKLKHESFRVFGPFASMHSAESVLRYLRKIVPYCTQRRIGKAACFYHKIGQCDPCPNVIEKMTDPEQKSQEKRRYRHKIKTLIKILDGDIEAVSRDFKKQIAEYTETQNFEAAIKARDAMRRLEFMIQHGSFQLDEYESYNRSQASLDALHTLLRSHIPALSSLHRIECYDNSTLSFTHSTASMVVFTDGLVDKREYKRFKMKKAHDNDFDMMREVMTRRGRNVKWPRPDLIVIDGGTPQLRTVIEAISSLDGHELATTQPQPDNDKISNYEISKIPIIGIAKRPDRLVIPIPHDPTSEFITLRPRASDLGFRMIQAIRDEAHRFAKKYHIHLRGRATKI